MLRASTAASVWNEMHAPCRYLNFSLRRDLQSHTDIQASRSRLSGPRDRESGHEGRGDTMSAPVLLRRKPFVEIGSFPFEEGPRPVGATNVVRPGRGESRLDSTPDRAS